VGITIRHAFLVTELASTAATALDDEVARLEAQRRDLRGREQSLSATRVDPIAAARWTLLKGLVDRRTFSWTGLFTRLETALPGDVRILSISPDVDKGRFGLEVDAVARNAEDAVSLVKTLEDLPEFEDVFLLTLNDHKDGARCHYRMFYRPDVTSASPAAAKETGKPTDDPEPAAEEATGDEGDDEVGDKAVGT
jgi:Tfp pilus assembly protein PilN